MGRYRGSIPEAQAGIDTDGELSLQFNFQSLIRTEVPRDLI